MPVLREEQCYGISSHTLDRGGNISVFHVKLTDSAARAMESFQNSTVTAKSSHPAILFNGNQGRITIPCAETGGDARTFTFGLSNVARDNPHGSFHCLQQLSTGAVEEELCCVGEIQEKMTVNATDDSYHKARQSMAQAEEETRSRGTIIIKQGARLQGKRVTVRAPAPALASLAKRRLSPSSPSSPLLGAVRRGPPRPKKAALASGERRGGAGMADRRGGVGMADRRAARGACVVDQRPLRERLAHLLALRPYRRPELVLRLQRDGLLTGDKDALDRMLLEVGQLNSRDNTYVLKGSLYKELQKDWPGYTTGDQQLLKRILVRRLFQPHHRRLLSVPETQVSPLRDTPNSSPARPHRPAPTEDYTDPLANKKPRISHLTGKTANGGSGSTGSSGGPPPKERETVAGATEEDHPRSLFDSLSEVGEQKVEAARRLEPATSVPEDRKATPPLPACGPAPPLTGPAPPRLGRHGRARRKSKHKHRDRDQEKVKGTDPEDMKGAPGSEDVMEGNAEPNGMFYDDSVLKAANDLTDYLLKYTVICGGEQRLLYKQDFNREYSEYRALHARIDGVTRQFMELDTQRKRLRSGSHRHQTVHNQIVQEYRKIKKSNPNYSQDKIRCEYLHNKLAHIKKVISEYDHNQITAVSS